jgi:CTP synthase (UTP-ammonia lyase)
MFRIGVIGDYDARPTHLATNAAISHSSDTLGIKTKTYWLATSTLAKSTRDLSHYDGLICAPGSPYKSMTGALAGIRYAREKGIPFLGTCGGFQHAALEFARNALLLKADHQEISGESQDSLVVPLSCDLNGKEASINLLKDSKAFSIYENPRITENFRCSYGLSTKGLDLFKDSIFKPVGFDDQQQVAVMELKEHPFFIATLFQPQLASTLEKPHPLILGFLRATQSTSASPG